MKLLTKYSICQCSLESFGMDGLDDVKYDGYASTFNKVMVNFVIGTYRYGGQDSNVKVYNEDN